ncbi:MAG: c-type cytochrome, partial [Planctomycetales bacterium]
DQQRETVAASELRLQLIKDYRLRLDAVLNAAKKRETDVLAEIDNQQREVNRLHEAWLARRGTYTKGILEQPVFDAFMSPLAIEQVWLPDLTINYNFSDVPRYDRCVTCHQAIDKSRPGAAAEPGNLPLAGEDGVVKVSLSTPTQAEVNRLQDAFGLLDSDSQKEFLLPRLYGMQVAAGPGEFPAVVNVVWPRLAKSEGDDSSPGFASRAIETGMEMGDVIKTINGHLVRSREDAIRFLWRDVEWGTPLELEVIRGYKHPYSTHPRLDLFVGSTSPHKKLEFGCTICHQGQGSATAFKWASHTPNTPRQKEAWERDNGWFNNHHWLHYQCPARFVESGCLQCHHNVTELEPSQRFPDPPAPKLVQGYHLIRQYGCYGCHEINGYDGLKRIGPDLRSEPNYAEAAQAVMAGLPTDDSESDAVQEVASLARQVIAQPAKSSARARLAALLRQDREKSDGKRPGESVFSSHAHAMVSILGSDSEGAGEFLKRGPSLRFLSKKTDRNFLYDWLRKPSHFRPTTRMPQFFGLHDDLPAPQPIADALADWSAGDWRSLISKLVAHDNPAELRVWSLLPAGLQAALTIENANASGSNAVSSELKSQLVAALEDVARRSDLLEPSQDQGGFELELKRVKESSAEIRTVLVRSPGDRSAQENQWVNRLLMAEPLQIPIGDAEFDDAYRYEPIEALALAHFLMKSSEAANPGLFEYEASYEEIQKQDPAKRWTAAELGLDVSSADRDKKHQVAAASADRGKTLFKTRGCLACHQLSQGELFSAEELKQIAAQRQTELGGTQGPELSNLGAKFKGENGKQWLYSWLKDPKRYHSRTRMPNVLLDPIAWDVKQDDGQTQQLVIDPAADIAAFLLDSKIQDANWKPYRNPLPSLDGKEPSPESQQALDELTLLYLEKSVLTSREAGNYLQTGIPESYRDQLRIDERILLRRDGEEGLTSEQKLEYVGRRTIARMGCAGCHDVPGMENEKPIGAGLNAWGRKETSQLAFEQITTYLGVGHGGHGEHRNPFDGSHVHLEKGETAQDAGFYLDSIQHHQREGFIWQKLREPRGYDHKKTDHKGYDERLRMPKFPFTPEEREAIMTFVLGLVAEPPRAAKYVYQPTPQRQAVLEGREVLEKFNCQGCHQLESVQWIFEIDPAKFAELNPGAPIEDSKTAYPYLKPLFSEEELLAAHAMDRAGRIRVEITGRQLPVTDREEGDELQHEYVLWEPTAVNGQAWRANQRIMLSDASLVNYGGNPDSMEPSRPLVGGDLGRLVAHAALEREKQFVQLKDGNIVWGWLPPPLMGEGRKVRTDWLHQFLLNPYAIRPATVLRMPKFNLSQQEARLLADYFAALEGETFPYEFVPQTEHDHLQRMNSDFAGRNPKESRGYMDAAFNLVANKELCLKCHRLGDYAPSDRFINHAPNLNQVHNRLRPNWIRDWIA